MTRLLHQTVRYLLGITLVLSAWEGGQAQYRIPQQPRAEVSTFRSLSLSTARTKLIRPHHRSPDSGGASIYPALRGRTTHLYLRCRASSQAGDLFPRRVCPRWRRELCLASHTPCSSSQEYWPSSRQVRSPRRCSTLYPALRHSCYGSTNSGT